MAYNSISIKPYIKSHLELQREITLIELAPSPYFFVESICLTYMNMFARFDENPAMTLQVIKKNKTLRTDARTHAHTDARTHGHRHGQREHSIPHHFVMKAPSMHIQKPYWGKIVIVLTAVILSKIIFSEPNSFMHMFNV